MVTNVAVGAPVEAFPVPVAPIAPKPLELVSTPLKLNTVSDDATLCDSVADTVTLLKVLGENAHQISDVPSCTFVRFTSDHTRPPPATFVTVVLGELVLSVEINANRSSFTAVVENVLVVTVALAVP